MSCKKSPVNLLTRTMLPLHRPKLILFGNILEAQDSLSDEALAHLKAYKYSSVDKSFVSRYILKHYVRLLRLHEIFGDTCSTYRIYGSGILSLNSSRYGLHQIW